MASIRELFVSLGLETDKGAFSVAEAAIAGLKGGLAGVGVALGAMAVAFGVSVNETVQAAGRIDDTAKRTGIARGALQELDYAAQQSGFSFGEMTQALNILGRNMNEAAQGGKTQAATFARLGLSIRDANGSLKSTDTLLMESADAIKALGTDTERTGAAMDLFGKSGTVLVPLLKEGRGEIDALRERARLLGFVMSDETVAAGDNLGDALLDVSIVAQGLGYTLAEPLLEPLKEVALAVAEWVAANRGLIKTNLGRVVKIVTLAFKALFWVLRPLTATIGWLADHWRLVALVLGGAVLWAIWANIGAIITATSWYAALSIASVVAGAKAGLAWIAATWPILLAVAALILLALVIEDVWTTLSGGDGVMIDFLEFMQAWVRSPGEGWLGNALRAVLALVFDLPKAWDTALTYYQKAFSNFADWLGKKMRAIPGMSFVLDRMSLESMLPGGKPLGAPTADAAFPQGATSPAASAANSPSAASKTTSNAVNATFTVNAAPGQSAEEVAGAVQTKMDQWWENQLGAAGAVQ